MLSPDETHANFRPQFRVRDCHIKMIKYSGTLIYRGGTPIHRNQQTETVAQGFAFKSRYMSNEILCTLEIC